MSITEQLWAIRRLGEKRNSYIANRGGVKLTGKKYAKAYRREPDLTKISKLGTA